MLVVCGSALSKAILQDKYKGLIDTTVNDVSGTDFEVIFASKDEIENKQTTKITSENPSNFFKSCILDPHFTFDNFVVGPSNKEASQAGLIVASSPAKLYNPLFIYGESGLGRRTF
jgi:chromosomal replication initiator protein